MQGQTDNFASWKHVEIKNGDAELYEKVRNVGRTRKLSAPFANFQL